MPRIYAPDPHFNSNAGAVPFVNGVAVVPATAADAIAKYTALGYDIDSNRHVLSPYDALTTAQIKAICDHQGVAYLAGDDKYAVIRKLEVALSTKYIGALTVASVAHGATMGNTVITVTEALTGTNIHKYKTHATTAPAPLYGDIVDATWLALTSGAAAGLTLTTGHKITVVECDPVTGFIFNSGNDTVASKDA